MKIEMENLEKLNVIELHADETVQISGGGFWRVVDFFSRASYIQDTINDFVGGWKSVKCGCQK